MSYAITPQKDPLLDESSRPIDRRKAAIGAALFTILLVLSVFLRFFSKQDPVPEPQGLITSFESIEIETGGGGVLPVTVKNRNLKTKHLPVKQRKWRPMMI